MRVTEALNEAKDNVKYLQTLEKFIDPLDNGSPDSIKEILPALMNSIKMIHTIARYYNTNERMTGLFANQDRRASAASVSFASKIKVTCVVL